MWYTVGPNEVMVISGCLYGRPAKIIGGRAWVWKCCQQVQRMSLNTMTIVITSPRIYTKLGVPITVTGVAQVKIEGRNEEMLDRACEMFLGKNEDQIRRIAQETLEGHQRAIIGLLTVEEIFRDRKKFSEAVFEVASSDLVHMGMSVVSYTIKDISDEAGYLAALGMTRTAQVKRDARVGEAEAKREAGIKQATANEERQAAKFQNDIEIAKAQRDYSAQQAIYDVEVNTKKAQADLAYKLQAAKLKQAIRAEELQVQVIERQQQILLQEQEIARRERELDATIRKPADAERYRIETLAEANRKRQVLEAEAKAEALRLKGEAEATAILANAKAEAEQMREKAAAFAEYQDAAKLSMLLEKLPQITKAVAAPLHECKKVTMISSGGEGAAVGVAKLTGEVFATIERLPRLVESLSGYDMTKDMKRAAGASTSSSGTASNNYSTRFK